MSFCGWAFPQEDVDPDSRKASTYSPAPELPFQNEHRIELSGYGSLCSANPTYGFASKS
ncbi:MAG: hypothetical protein P8M30_04660 [Planctomycetaceae bacterium]|nr:hypothetical protein [Planctomycetaceae bacterium]